MCEAVWGVEREKERDKYSWYFSSEESRVKVYAVINFHFKNHHHNDLSLPATLSFLKKVPANLLH